MHDSANTQRRSIDRSLRWEFWAIASQTGLLRKPHPTLEHLNGMSFPVEVSSGNCSPESALRLGCNFPMGPSGKLRPGICAQNGTRFPQGPNQPPAPRQNHPLSSVACRTSKECPRVPAQLERPQLPAAFRRNCKTRAGNRSHLRGFSGRSQRYATEAHVSYGLPNGTGTRCLSRLTKR